MSASVARVWRYKNLIIIIIIIGKGCLEAIWYGILEFNVPLDTVSVISETGSGGRAPSGVQGPWSGVKLPEAKKNVLVFVHP